MQIGTSLEGSYNCCPPPGSVGFLKKIKRVAKRAGKGIVKAHKKVGKVVIKAHTAPLKVAAKAGKYAAKQLAKVAALPIRLVFKKLATRRARYLAYQRTKTTTTSPQDRKEASEWAIAKVRKAGPIGFLAVKILKFTGGATVGTSRRAVDVNYMSEVGMTGAEIAAAAATIVATITKIMGSLNKKGEAPENPAEGAASETQPEVQPVVESDDAEPAQEEPAREEPTEEANE